MELTSSESAQVPATPALRLAAQLSLGADSAPTVSLRQRRHFNWFHHGIDGVLELEISPLTSTVILRDRSPRATAVVTSAMLRT